MRKHRAAVSSYHLHPVCLCVATAVTSFVLFDFRFSPRVGVVCGAVSRRNEVEPWLPGVFERDPPPEWTTSGDSARGGLGTTDGGAPLLDDDMPYWFVATALPCIHPLDECTYIINGTYPFAGLLSDTEELQQPSSAAPGHVRSDTNRDSSSGLRVQRVKESERDVHVIPEQPEDPCVVSGRIDVPHNWFGYLGVFRLRRSDSPSISSSSPARVYYRVVYPAGGRTPVSLLFYLGEQVRSLNVRMNCFQRVKLVDPVGPQVVQLDPTVPHSGCVNRSRTADDSQVRGRDDRRSTSSSSSSSSRTVIDCRGGRVLRSNVERQWNVAVSSCGSPTGLALTYTLVVYGHRGRCPLSPGLSRVTWSTQPETAVVCLSAAVAMVTMTSSAIRS